MNRQFKNKSINDAIMSISVKDDALLKDLSCTVLEKERTDGKSQRLSYVAYFSGTLISKTVGRRFWQEWEESSNSCVWKNAPDPELLREMRGQRFTLNIVFIELNKTYTIENKDKSMVETNKYSFILMENEDLEEELEKALIHRNIISANEIMEESL